MKRAVIGTDRYHFQTNPTWLYSFSFSQILHMIIAVRHATLVLRRMARRWRNAVSIIVETLHRCPKTTLALSKDANMPVFEMLISQ